MADETDRRPDPHVLREGYEQLRARVLAGRPDGWRLGHAVLARHGMAGWIAARAAVAWADRTGPTPIRPHQPARAPAPAADCGRIVAVLSQMALAHAA